MSFLIVRNSVTDPDRLELVDLLKNKLPYPSLTFLGRFSPGI